MVNNKSDLKKQIEKNLSKFPLINQYYLKTILNLVDRTNNLLILLENPSVRYAASNDGVFSNLEKHIKEHSFANIEVPLKRLETNFDEYQAVMAELRTAKFLKEEGMSDISFIKEEDNPDISYKENGIIRYAEVKNLKELDPEFPILDNKLEAKSIFEPNFQRNFYIQMSHNLLIGSLKEYVKKFGIAVDKLIEALNGCISAKNAEDLIFEIDNFKFIVSITNRRDGYHLMYSGEVMMFGSSKDIFLGMSSVYSRFINASSDGLRQLVKKRNKNLVEVKSDRLYLFLNTGRYANFVPEELKKILPQLSKVIGIDDLVTLKLEL